MALSERLAILITANGAQAMSEFQKVGVAAERSLVTTEQRVQRFGASLTRVGAGMVAFGAVLSVGMYKAAQAAGEQEAANLRLENTMANQPSLAGASAQAFYDQASALQEVTRFGDEATVTAQSMLGQFGLTQDQILQLIPLVQDYAAKTGTDLETAARNVGKSTAGMNMTLRRQGIDFNDTAYAADNYGETLAALRGYAGGFAEQEGQTLAGQLDILKNRFGELAEGVGAGAIEAFSSMAGAATWVADALEKVSPGAQSAIGKLLTFSGVGVTVVGAMSVVVGQVIKVSSALRALPAAAAAAQVSLTTLAVEAAANPLVALAAVAGTAVLAISQFGDGQQSAAAAADEFTNAIRTQGDAMAGLEAAVASLSDTSNSASGEELTDAMAAAGATSEDLRAALTGTDADLEAFAQRLANTGMVTEEMISDWDALKNAFSLQPTDETVAPLDRTRSALENLRGSLREATGEQATQNAVFGDTAGAAGAAADGIDELSAAIDDYMSLTFDVPEAQRNLQTSFADLQEAMLSTEPSWITQAAGMQEVVENTGAIISAQVLQGATQGQLDATIQNSIGVLRGMRDTGAITGAQFDTMRGQILGIPTTRQTAYSAPGLTASSWETVTYRDRVYRVPTGWSTTFTANTGTAQGNIDALIGRIQALNSAVASLPSTNSIAAQVGAMNAALAGSGRSVESATQNPKGTPAATPTIIVVPTIDEAMNRAGVRTDHRAVIRRRVLAGAR